MLCISVRQPWAWAIIHGGKTIENRRWRIHHRGPLAIHASSGCGAKWLRDSRWPMPSLPDPEELILGAVIGIVDVIDCLPAEDCRRDPWAAGPWCWKLSNPRPITPHACRGYARLFHVPDRLVEPVESRLVLR